MWFWLLAAAAPLIGAAAGFFGVYVPFIFLYKGLLGRTGMYNAVTVREEMGEPFAAVPIPTGREVEPAFEFAEL